MSAVAVVPEISGYRELVLASGAADNLTRILIVGDYLYGISASSPSKIIKINRSNLSDYTVATFASDGNHDLAADMLYVQSTNRIYVTFPETGKLVISAVNPDTLAITDALNTVDASGGGIAIDSDGTNLYVLLQAAANIISLRQYPLSDFDNPTEIDVSTLRGADGLIHYSGSLYFVGWTVGNQASPRIYRITTSGFTTTSAALVSGAAMVRLHHTAINAGTLYFLSEEVATKVWSINPSTLANQIVELPSGDHAGLTADGTSAWNLRTSGMAIRIKADLSTQIYTLNSGEGYIKNIVGDGQYLYAAWFQTGSKIARYQIGPASGAVLWVHTAGHPATSDYANAVTADSDGNVIVTGGVNGFLFLNKYSPDGDVNAPNCWSKGAVHSGFGSGVATDSAKNIYVSAVSLGGSGGAGFSDISVHKYDAAGTLQWSKKFTGPTVDDGNAVTVGPDGHPVVTGKFYGSVTFGATVLTSAGGSDIFVAKLNSATGVPIWANRYGETEDAENDVGKSVSSSTAQGADGSIFLSGHCGTPINFGTGSLGTGGLRGFLLKLDSAGSLQWAKIIGSALANAANGVAALSDGGCVVVGYFMGTHNFGDGAVTSTGRRDIFIARYDYAGTFLWKKVMGASYQVDDIAFGVAVDKDDNIIVTGYFAGDMTVGSDTFSGPNDVIILKYDSSGRYIWGRSYGSWSTDRGFGVGVDPSGNILVSGHFYGDVDFGGIRKQGPGGGDAFVLKMTP